MNISNMIYQHLGDMKSPFASLKQIHDRVKDNYKKLRISNPHLEQFKVWCLLCVEVYGCDKDEQLIKDSWDEFKASQKKSLGKKQFKKRKLK